MARPSRYNKPTTVNKKVQTRPTPVSVAPSGARPEPTFVQDVATGAVNVGKSFVNPNRSQEDYEAWSQGKELQNKPLAELGIGALSGQYTKEEVYEETERRVKEEPGKVVGEVAVEGALAIVPGSKVQKLGKMGTDVLKQKLGHSVAGWTDTPKPQSTGKILDLDVNKLNKEIDIAKTKVRDEDIMISPRGNESYSPTSNPMEPRSHVDKYYEKLAEEKVFGRDTNPNNPASWTESSSIGPLDDVSSDLWAVDKAMAKRFAASDPKKLREFLGDKGLFDETQKAYKVPVEPFQNKSPKWDDFVSNQEVFTLNKLKDWNKASKSGDYYPRDEQFFKGDKFLTGAGATAGGLGVFGLGAKKDGKRSN